MALSAQTRLSHAPAAMASASLDKELWRVFRASHTKTDRLCGLVVRVPGYRSRGPGSIFGAIRFSEKQWVWNEIHSTSLNWGAIWIRRQAEVSLAWTQDTEFLSFFLSFFVIWKQKPEMRELWLNWRKLNRFPDRDMDWKKVLAFALVTA
jgi:hypothetical protein